MTLCIHKYTIILILFIIFIFMTDTLKQALELQKRLKEKKNEPIYEDLEAQRIIEIIEQRKRQIKEESRMNPLKEIEIEEAGRMGMENIDKYYFA